MTRTIPLQTRPVDARSVAALHVEPLHGEALAKAADTAVRAIPPAYPLTATVAVNPFLGQSGERLPMTAARLARISGLRLALPRGHHAERIARARSSMPIFLRRSPPSRPPAISIRCPIWPP